jgi:hypothetical protein
LAASGRGTDQAIEAGYVLDADRDALLGSLSRAASSVTG